MQELRDSFLEKQSKAVTKQARKQLRAYVTEMSKTIKEEAIKHDMFEPLCFMYDAYGENIELEEAKTMIRSVIDLKKLDIFKYMLNNASVFLYEENFEEIFKYCVENKRSEFAQFILDAELFKMDGDELKKKKIAVKLLGVDEDD